MTSSNDDGSPEPDPTVLPPWVEAYFAQERATYRAARGEQPPQDDDWCCWEEELHDSRLRLGRRA